ncbi:putative DNA primase/helicase [Serratia fonticola]|uniref:Putative DNA primase/helicase n=1 Tax=Serratia fonticola TaxID=47917 RepID=A0A542CS03_SERFO|nr:LPD7 domain-containing protein [Serratia fonticola]TQI77287.1 putative DNA primase/helicase [Serratia fonticola]TQI93587.1 putative DNA primase/helicase [Serratia fonticola]TVZ61616.1 putative DNA primase/helicase [Serratia fonticola]
MQKRTYLTITPDNKKDALRAAGRLADGSYALEYDGSEKLWFAKPNADLEKVKPWLPENSVAQSNQTTTDNLTPAEEFAQVLEDAGFIFPSGDLPEMDGKKHRVYVEGQKNISQRKNKYGDYPGGAGVYQGFMDGRPAGWYENHRASEGKVNWTSTGSFTYDPTEAIKQRALAAQKRWDREIQSQLQFTQMGKTLTRQWSKMPPAPETHAYLVRKGVPAADGVRLDKYDNLVIPLRNSDGELRTLQYIKPDGTKNLKKGAEKTGNFFVVGGELSSQRPVLYAEGYATAASLHLATGMPVVMTVDAGNLVTVSRNLKERYPDNLHIILGEDDFTKTNNRGEQDNKGAKKAQEAAAAINGIYIIPSFTESERAQAFAGTASFSDFNDIHVANGLDAVREQLAPIFDELIPDWRQSFTETHNMPDNDIRQDDPAIPFPDITDYPDFGDDYQDAFVPHQDKPESTSASVPPLDPEAEATPPLSPDDQASHQVPDEPVLNVEPAEPEAVGTSPTDAASLYAAEASTVANAPTAPPDLQNVPQADAVNAQTPPTDSPPPADATAETQLDDVSIPPATELPLKNASSPEESPQPATTEADTAPDQENGFSFTFGRLPGDISPEGPEVARINLDELLQGLTSRQEDRTWVYALDGEDAFRDYGDRIVMASPQASGNDRMILAALLSAKANQRGAVEVTGSPEFIHRTLTLIADHCIQVHLKNPQQREQFEALLQARATEAAAKNGINISTPGQEAVQAPATDTQPAAPDAATDATWNDTASQIPQKVAEPAVPEMTVFEKETLRTGLTGKLLESGRAPYQFDKANTESFYVQLRTKAGNKTYWGVELEKALEDSGQKQGDIVKLQYLGKQPVMVNVPVTNKEGVVTGYERQEKHRNHWSLTPAQDNRLLVADRHHVAPSELSAYDGNAFWQLQQRVVRAADLPLSLPDPNGHGLLYTGPNGEGQKPPQSPPENAVVPAISKAAGSVVMHAASAEGELLAHLVKGHGDYLQGVMRHEGELRHVLARVCTGANGNTWLAVNTVSDSGALALIGHGSAVNVVKNGEALRDTFAFELKGKDTPKFAVPLVSPEKLPPALHSKLGFDKPWTPPKAQEPEPAPRAQVKPANQPQPM